MPESIRVVVLLHNQAVEKHLLGRLFKKAQMQGGEEARSETYLDVRCNDERRILCSSAGFACANWGEVRKGGEPPSEESLRSRWAFFNSLPTI